MIKGKNKNLTTTQHVYRKNQARARYCVLDGLKRFERRSIKMVEMWYIWGPLIEGLVERNKLCLKPRDASIAQLKGDKVAKSVSRRTGDLALIKYRSSSLGTRTVYVPPNKPMKNGL